MKSIEFIGLPGSGKTTIVEKIIEKGLGKTRFGDRNAQQTTAARTYSALSRTKRMSDFLGFCEEYSDFVFYLGLLISSLHPIHYAGFRRTLATLKQFQSGKIFQNSTRPYDIMIYDQDILQEIWGILYLREVDEQRLMPLLGSISSSLPDLVVWVDIPGKLAKQRMKQRADQLGQFTGEIDAMPNLSPKRLDQANQDFYLLGKLCQHFGSELLILDGCEDTDLLVEKVLSKLKESELFDF